MKDKLFPIFITLLAFIAAYVFYSLWHSGELSPVPVKKQTQEKQNYDLSNKKVIPKHAISLALPTPEIVKEEKRIIKNISFQSQKEAEAKTQEVYDEMIPEGHEETMEFVNDAFNQLDEEVAAIDEKIAEEEERGR